MINLNHPFFTNKQELANSLSHGLGMVFGIISIPLLVTTALHKGQWEALLGSSIYSMSFLMVFTTSTLYHGCHRPKLKQTFKILDHISIYFLIAGSYTPFVLLYYYNGTGITLLLLLWGLTLVGTVFKLWFTGRFELLSTGIYLLMGWMLIFVGKSFFANFPMEVVWLIVAGGILYTLGVIFFLWERYHYHHAVWHLFVLAGGICHFVAVWMAVD